MRTLFAVNIALKQPSGSHPSTSPEANDGALDTCFLTIRREAFWYLALGANVRVSMVFIVHDDSHNFEGFDIGVVGVFFQRLPVSSVYYSLVLCYHRSVSCI